MSPADINSPAAAFIAGLVTSLHCLGMCGPIACWLAPRGGANAAPAKKNTDVVTVSVVYQLCRLASYSLLGLLAGAIGGGILQFLGAGVLQVLPWIMVVFFLAVAFRLDRHLLPRFPKLAGILLRLQGRLGRYSQVSAAALLGTATPLLPCGPLYFVVGISAMTGSALSGLEFMLAFGCGTLPLLWLAQLNFGWLRARVSPIWISRTQTILSLAAALLITWRLRSTLGFAGPDASEFFCCH